MESRRRPSFASALALTATLALTPAALGSDAPPKKVAATPKPPDLPIGAKLVVHDPDAYSITMDPSGRTAAIVGARSVRLRDPRRTDRELSWPGRPAWVRWSPDGSRIAVGYYPLVTGNTGGGPGIEAVVLFDAKTSTKIKDWSDASQFEWMPDGRRALLTRDNPDPKGEDEVVVLVEMTGGSETQLTTCANAFFAPSPSGNHIAFADAGRLRLITLPTGEVKELLPAGDGGVMPFWSQDGSRLGAVTEDEDQMYEAPLGRLLVWSMSTPDAQPKLLSRVSVPGLHSGAFSADGKTIAYLNQIDDVTTLMTVRLEGRPEKPISRARFFEIPSHGWTLRWDASGVLVQAEVWVSEIAVR